MVINHKNLNHYNASFKSGLSGLAYHFMQRGQEVLAQLLHPKIKKVKLENAIAFVSYVISLVINDEIIF